MAQAKSLKVGRPKPMDRAERTVSVPEAGAMVGLGRNASYQAARSGEIPTIKIGGNPSCQPRPG